ncbi:MAG TPA: transposase [Acidiferrobacteraceae bacterium]|nr:transposase [Acidiferrobacteraceae bacterium]
MRWQPSGTACDHPGKSVQILGVEEIKSIPYTPRSHPFVERLIGTIRREYLDHTLFWNAQDLERKLALFRRYYNQNRPHQALGGEIPAGVAGDHQFTTAKLDNYAWQSHCGGLFQTPVPA